MGKLYPTATFKGEDMGLDLPVIVVDDDFVEFVEEECYETMDVVEFWELWNQWEKDNVK